jgi:hypothetical protein
MFTGIKKSENLPGKVLLYILVLSFAAALLFFMLEQIAIAFLLLGLPFVLFFIGTVFREPGRGFIALLFANYFALGVARYIPGPLGLSVDGLLVLTWLALFFSQLNRKVEWRKAWNGLTIVALVWYAYALLQLLNPEARSLQAWFYAMRGVSLYMLLTIPLVFLVFNREKDLNLMIQLWAWFTLLGVLKGVMQKVLGPDPWETYWLDTIGGKTHRLPQGLRIFSFFSDSSVFGGSMGFSGVFFSILGLHASQSRKKVFYIIVAAAAFLGMLLSGTRGAIAVPFAGFALYLLLSKRVKMMVIGGLTIIAVFSILKFTTLGESVYEIRRFRDALDPENPSLVVRKENQAKFRVYLADKPFGGGIGSAGNWGLRFTPGTFLAETPPDGWYVQIWAEQGIVGLLLHLSILTFIMLKSAYIILFRLKKPENIAKAMGFSAGIFGVMAASYSSGALGQMPNGIIIYSGMAFIFLMVEWEKAEDNERYNL